MAGVVVKQVPRSLLSVVAFLALVRPEELWRPVERELSRSCPWDCLVFVQMWPGSFCVALGRKLECVIPKNADIWTIHGLWPRNVIQCCPYWRLFPSDLVDLMPELTRYWPTFTNLSNFQFWEKEWQKHGTCAGCAETLNSPSKYFRASLSLRSKYNIDRAFQRGAIVPSCNHSYQLNTFVEVLQPILGDQYELQCITDTQGRQILVQIKVSIYSNFSTGCLPEPSDYSPYKPCRAQRSIFYFPPHQANPRDPCP
ncbi:PREDICTED: ribonuclease T2-like [Gekko japonicus]|uniref:Ribonuclease T2-like n=1 Tax=Gekko japonicus TaxID=146911 RepID=A0ABM1JQL6_GEKJA|nr:PREDICTED: ribonuclease T2-like [Gekko japonicus]